MKLSILRVAWYSTLFYLLFIGFGSGSLQAQSGASNTGSEIPSLPEPGVPFKRLLKDGETHWATFQMKGGEYIHLEIIENLIDFIVVIHDPLGNQVTKSKTPADEWIDLIATIPGQYRMEVKTTTPGQSPLEYSITILAQRPAIPSDRIRVEVQHLESETTLAFESGDTSARKIAIEQWQRALSLIQSVSSKEPWDNFIEGVLTYSIALAAKEAGDLNLALDMFEQAHARYQEIPNILVKALILSQLGLLREKRGEFEPAISRLKESVPLWQQIGDQNDEGAIWFCLARIYSRIDQPRKTVQSLEKALVNVQAGGDRFNIASTLNNLAAAYQHLGDNQKALENYLAAQKIFQELGQKKFECIVLLNIGVSYRDLNEPKRAFEYLERGLSLAQEVNDSKTEASLLQMLGVLSYSEGRYPEAQCFVEQAFSIWKRLNQPGKEGIALSSLGMIHLQAGRLTQASEYYRQALERLLSSKLDPTQYSVVATVHTLYEFGKTLERQGIIDQAAVYFDQAVTIGRQSQFPQLEAQALYQLAGFERRHGQIEKSWSTIQKSFQLYESNRTAESNPEFRAVTSEPMQNVFEFAIDLQMARYAANPQPEFLEEAFSLTERTRARSLLDILATAQVNFQDAAHPELIAQEREERERLVAKQTRLIRLLQSPDGSAQARELQTEIDALNINYQKTLARIRSKSPAYADFIQPQPVTAREVQNKLLDSDTVLVSYVLGTDRSFCWVISKKFLECVGLPNRQTIEPAVDDYVTRLTGTIKSGTTPAATKKSGGTLSQLVLTPIDKYLSGFKRVLVVPDGSLFHVPFGVLSSSRSGQPLIMHHEIVILPSASTLAVLRTTIPQSQPNPKTIAIFANPVFSDKDPRFTAKDQPLASQSTPQRLPSSRTDHLLASSGFGELPMIPNTGKQADEICALLEPSQYFRADGFDATKQTVIQSVLGQYRYAHFATHGCFDQKHPDLSGLAFAMIDQTGQQIDGYLLTSDILNLNLKGTQLVVLSACQTSLGKKVRGEGIIGLTRAFMYAGSPRIIAALWSVSDASTAELMKRFYQHLLSKTKPITPAQALRAAQLEMMTHKVSKWRDPFYWAAFQLQGEYH